MVRQTRSTKTTVRSNQSCSRIRKICLQAALIAAVMIFGDLSVSKAESIASRNRQGNRFFAQGKYAEAEKTYLDAEVNSPGRPEILYNLGNSLIKQKKYGQGIQALRQSIGKGDKGIQEKSWYNSGNAFYSMGNYKDAIESFIQALKLDSTDRDAKHNLELARLKLKQQEQKQSDKSQKQKDSGKASQEQPSTGKNGQQEPNKQDQAGAGEGNKQNEPASAQSGQAAQRTGSISKERAVQILDAVQNQEIDQQRKLLEHRARHRVSEKDW